MTFFIISLTLILFYIMVVLCFLKTWCKDLRNQCRHRDHRDYIEFNNNMMHLLELYD